VFSSDAAPFEPGRNYSKFAAHTILNHKGNFDAAGDELAKAGFGRVDAAVNGGEYLAKRRPLQERIGVRTAADIIERFNTGEADYVMEDIMPYGLTVLACPYKFDTSHIAFDLCLTIGNPTKRFLGLYEFSKDIECLYFSLEDTEFLLHERINRLLNMRARYASDRHTMSDRVKITMNRPPEMGQEFCDMIDEYLTANPRCKLVVIDSYNALVHQRTAMITAPKQKKHADMLRKVATKHSANIFLTMRVQQNGKDHPYATASNPVLEVKQAMPIAGMSDSSLVITHEAYSSGLKIMLNTGGRHTKPKVHELRKVRGLWHIRERHTNVTRHKYVDEIIEYCEKTGERIISIIEFERWLWDEHRMKSMNMRAVFKRLYLLNYLNKHRGQYWLTV
jgi:hypothetical protein